MIKEVPNIFFPYRLNFPVYFWNCAHAVGMCTQAMDLDREGIMKNE